jgi:hypothetical protein
MQVRGMGHHFQNRSCMLLRAKDSAMELLSQEEDDMHSWGRVAAHVRDHCGNPILGFKSTQRKRRNCIQLDRHERSQRLVFTTQAKRG